MKNYIILDYSLKKITDRNGNVISFYTYDQAQDYLYSLFDYYSTDEINPEDYQIIRTA